MTGPRLGIIGIAWLAAIACTTVFFSCDPQPTSPQLSRARFQLGTPILIRAPGRRLVTPRWSATGDRLLASGRFGIGLYTATPDAPATVQLLDPTFRGKAEILADGRLVKTPTAAIEPVRVLHQTAARQVSYLGRYGEVLSVVDGEAHLLASNAWGAVASSDGELVAYCEGPRAESTLTVVDARGRLVFEGPGTDPAWLPGRRALVYAEVEARPDGNGLLSLTGADLYLLDLSSQRSTQLTSTRHNMELQPAVSPDGERVAYADWRTGAIGVAVLAEQGGVR